MRDVVGAPVDEQRVPVFALGEPGFGGGHLAIDGQPDRLSVDGELATAESGFTQGKYRQRLIVYRAATG